MRGGGSVCWVRVYDTANVPIKLSGNDSNRTLWGNLVLSISSIVLRSTNSSRGFKGDYLGYIYGRANATYNLCDVNFDLYSEAVCQVGTFAAI